MMAKASASAADVTVFDLEDGVAGSKKREARGLVRQALEDLDFSSKEASVRVNSLDSGWLVEDLLAVVTPALRAVHIPKAEHPKAIWVTEEVLRCLERDRQVPHPIAIVPTLETVKGLRNARRIATCSERVAALQFGIADFVAETGIKPSPHRLAVARSAVVFAAAETGIQALDTGYLAIRDLAGYEAEAREARDFGFAGKTCLHPAQVPIANRVFSPDAAEIEHARAIVEAFEAESGHGAGTMEVDGQMIDEPIARRAARLIAIARQLGFL
jgi:citrate lyase subunit beta/citryl-CoA lyase